MKPTAAAAAVATKSTTALLFSQLSSTLPDSMKQQPGESNSSYMKRLQQLASNPRAFENQLRVESDGYDDAGSSKKKNKKDGTTNSTIDGNSNSNDDDDDDDNNNNMKKKKKRGYQRVEDWDKEQAEIAKQMSWEERVQFDGQRNGNKFNQNEILRHNLNTF